MSIFILFTLQANRYLQLYPALLYYIYSIYIYIYNILYIYIYIYIMSDSKSKCDCLTYPDFYICMHEIASQSLYLHVYLYLYKIQAPWIVPDRYRTPYPYPGKLTGMGIRMSSNLPESRGGWGWGWDTKKVDGNERKKCVFRGGGS
jgi:hypothetical protein